MKKYQRPFYGFQTQPIDLNNVRDEKRVNSEPDKKVSFSTGKAPEYKSGKERMLQLPSYPKFVKGYALANNMDYKEALKSDKVKALYRKTYSTGETGVITQLMSSFVEPPKPKVIPISNESQKKEIFVDPRMNDSSSLFQPTNVAQKIMKQGESQMSRNIYNDLKQCFFNDFLRVYPIYENYYKSTHNQSNFKPLNDNVLNAMLNMMLSKSGGNIVELSPFSEICVAKAMNSEITSLFRTTEIKLTEHCLSPSQAQIVMRLKPSSIQVLPNFDENILRETNTYFLNTSACNRLFNIYLSTLVRTKRDASFEVYFTNANKLNTVGDLYKGVLDKLFFQRLGFEADDVDKLVKIYSGKVHPVQISQDEYFTQTQLLSRQNTQNIVDAINSLDPRQALNQVNSETGLYDLPRRIRDLTSGQSTKIPSVKVEDDSSPPSSSIFDKLKEKLSKFNKSEPYTEEEVRESNPQIEEQPPEQVSRNVRRVLPPVSGQRRRLEERMQAVNQQEYQAPLEERNELNPDTEIDLNEGEQEPVQVQEPVPEQVQEPDAEIDLNEGEQEPVPVQEPEPVQEPVPEQVQEPEREAQVEDLMQGEREADMSEREAEEEEPDVNQNTEQRVEDLNQNGYNGSPAGIGYILVSATSLIRNVLTNDVNIRGLILKNNATVTRDDPFYRVSGYDTRQPDKLRFHFEANKPDGGFRSVSVSRDNAKFVGPIPSGYRGKIYYASLETLRRSLPEVFVIRIARAYLRYIDSVVKNDETKRDDYNRSILQGNNTDRFEGFSESYEGYGFKGGSIDLIKEYRNLFNPKITYLGTSGVDHLHLLSFSA